ncbi:hypothetical protein PsorP6_004789 [Peronosclerospora sorghi]|uniref:Uncharacterized protein n=1 Tax=Peronosclerospora sorghi TaxID=230839 RepID=A0ACC0VJ73_9STRA|nr:hypothetical protein PsorP6_004789 [Peronosclerospora sorghi]
MSDVSDSEIAACVATLQKLQENKAHELFQSSPRFKSLRTVLVPLFQTCVPSFIMAIQPLATLCVRSVREQRKIGIVAGAKSILLANVPDVVTQMNKLMLLKENEEARIANEKELDNSLYYIRACYTCKVKFSNLHNFYDRIADLRGYIAIVTGARLKIGYEITLKLLRSGALVVTTTRFPKDVAFRYAKEKDFEV